MALFINISVARALVTNTNSTVSFWIHFPTVFMYPKKLPSSIDCLGCKKYECELLKT